ncbi:dUTP diphosphatase [Saliterribacillus persicus]|uniref:Dimeric dUTPase (All-alpha-NTP-PPase superfamily) n=1 Tax=Saliterribacillus persicus TaxID=930114 RepID=A0A368XED5_9BACI|nr:dUTP diphosphatase [Saliterribacillus persicus]RCW66341.1 dimeric dUTPase (all-alpha-NTP-PPase superfamily) [Saliterribacillus persicus]
MNWNELFKMQAKLDLYIAETHQLENEDVFDKKILALLVEIGELANETRCFKFWSLKPASEDEVIAEEYVDGVHFILSLGLDLGIQEMQIEVENHDKDLTGLFHSVFDLVLELKHQKSKVKYKDLFHTYLQLGAALGLSSLDIQNAYINKNEINYERQNSGY